MKKVLIVDDDPSMVSLIENALRQGGYVTLSLYEGKKVLEVVEGNDVDAVILDMMLPDTHGLSILKAIRESKSHSNIPIIIVTGDDDETETVIGLELGADDYVHKPFNKRELLARLNVVFRRMKQDRAFTGKPIHMGMITLNPMTHQVHVDDKKIDLSPKEYKLLLVFMTNPNRIFTRDELLDKVWDDIVAFETRTVDVHVRRLRAKVEADPNQPLYIETIRGYGYRFTHHER